MLDIVRKQIDMWANDGEPVPLFDSISNLSLEALLHMLVGTDFAQRHVKELVPKVRAYEQALQAPETRLLPRWMSKAGRLLISVERRYTALLNCEIRHRMENIDKFRDNKDYLQIVLNAVGDNYFEGIFHCILRSLKHSLPIPYSWDASRRASKSDICVHLGTTSCTPIPIALEAQG